MADPVTQGTTLDILPNRSGPPLSATSDMPVVAAVETPAVVEPKAPAESEVLRADPPIKVESKPEDAPKPEGEVTQTAEEIAAAETAKKAAREDNTDPAVKREITKERNKAREATTKAAAAEAKADQLQADVSRLTEAVAKLTEKPAEPTVDPRPTRDKFETPDAYDDALIAWSGRQAAEVTRAEVEKANLEAKQAEDADRVQKDQQAQQDQIAAEWKTRRDQAIEKYPDYAEVAESDDIQISIPMSFAILSAGDAGTELAYHLGKNPEEAARIAGLVMPDGRGGVMPNAPMQVFELGKLAAKIAAPKPVSKTPDPITPLGARERAAETPPEEMSMEEYANSAAVKARLNGDRRGGRAAH